MISDIIKLIRRNIRGVTAMVATIVIKPAIHKRSVYYKGVDYNKHFDLLREIYHWEQKILFIL